MHMMKMGKYKEQQPNMVPEVQYYAMKKDQMKWNCPQLKKKRLNNLEKWIKEIYYCKDKGIDF